MLAPIDAAVMGASQDPRLSTAARGVELYRQLVNFHENDLHDVFRFTDVLRKMNGKWLIVHEHLSFPVDPETGKADFLSKP